MERGQEQREKGETLTRNGAVKSGKILHELGDVGTGKSLVKSQLLQGPPHWFSTREGPDPLFHQVLDRLGRFGDKVLNQNIFCDVHGDQ